MLIFPALHSFASLFNRNSYSYCHNSFLYNFKMSSALSNPVILDKIFGYFYPHQLKKIRLICKIWADIAASHLARQTTLNANHIRPCPTEVVEFYPHLNPKLGRRLKIAGPARVTKARNRNIKPVEPLNEDYLSSTMELFILLVSEVHNFTTHLDLKDIKHSEVSLLIEAFSFHDFPELTNISFHNTENLAIVDSQEVICPQLPPFPERKTLSTIHYWDGPPISWPRDKHRKNKIFPFRPWLQACLDSAPKLQRLKIVDNFYPNLNICGRKLKSLEFDGWPNKKELPPDTDETFDLDELIRIIAQVSGTIETLRLGSYINEEALVLRGYNFAVKPSSPPIFQFPKLTRLDLGTIEYFELLTNTFLNLGKAAPNLTHISLSGLHSKKEVIDSNMVNYDPDLPVETALQLLSSSGPHSKIVSLSLAFHKNVNSSLIRSLRLGSVFPSLESLNVIMPSPIWPANTEMGPELLQKIECFDNWSDLIELNFKVKGHMCPDYVCCSIDSFSNFTAERKVITILGNGSHFPTEGECPMLQYALLSSRPFTSFNFKSLKIEISLLEFLLKMRNKHQLPIVFKDCLCTTWEWKYASSLHHPIEGVKMTY